MSIASVALSPTGFVILLHEMEFDSAASMKLRIQNSKGFSDYGVSDGNVLHLVLKLSDLQAIDVRTDQELVCDGEELEDQRLITDICKYNDAVVHLLLRNSVKHTLCVIKELIDLTFDGLERGKNPIWSSEGSGGANFMQDSLGQKFILVFKPIDEEPMAANNPHGLPLSLDGEGLKKGTRAGEGALREVAAYLLDVVTFRKGVEES
ncbi:hypothetical protein DITRI_Ditri07aG0097600 [Diplodiscus trichospermus]